MSLSAVELVQRVVKVKPVMFCILPGIGTTGEVLIIHNVSRECGGQYECEADNKIGDIARKQMFIDVQCRYIAHRRMFIDVQCRYIARR